MFKDQIESKNGTIYFTGTYLEIYVPKSFIENNIAEDVGNLFKAFGILHLRTFDAKNNPGPLELLNLPSMINLYPSEKEEMNLTINDRTDRYIILKFFKNGAITDLELEQSSINCEIFINLLLNGKLPTTVDYSKINRLWDKNLSMNSVNFGVPATIRSVIIAEGYRSKEKPELRYAKIVGKNFTKVQLDYVTSNVREMCARNSAFAGLTFEDFDYMLTSAININKYNRTETISPVEKIIKM